MRIAVSLEIPLPPGDIDPLVRSAILTDPRQRYLLALLSEEPGPMTDRDLAVQIAIHESRKAPAQLTEEDYEEILVALRHRYIPKFEELGWIRQRPVGIIPTRKLTVESPTFSFQDVGGLDRPSWGALATILARPHRRTILTAINEHEHPLTLDELGKALSEIEDTPWTVDGRDGDPALCSRLHHIDLPKLNDAGLIEYDSDARTVIKNRSLSSFLDQVDIGDI